VSNNAGSATSTNATLTVVFPEPVAAFSGSPTNGGAALVVTFNDTSTGNITNRFWSFGDSNTTNTTATSLDHTYSLAGTYTVSLTVSGLGGSNASTQSNYIVVVNPAHLVVNPGSLNFASVTIGLSNSFTFSVINTGDLPLSGTAASATPFSIIGGGIYNNLDSGQTQTVTVAFEPSSAGAFTGSVIFVSDGGNSTNTVIGTGLTLASISVTPAVRDFGALATGTTIQASFVVTNSGGTAVSNGTATALGGLFTIVAGATFGVPGLGTTNVTVQFAPVTVGAFTDNVAFASDNGGAVTNTVTGTGALVPAASFSGSPTVGTVPLAITFTDVSTGTITNRSWNFGDGGTTNTTETSVAYTYNSAGTNTVSLTVYGPVGTSNQTRTAYIVVTNPPPPVAAFSGSPTTGATPLPVTFIDGSTGNITNRFWDFGDGGTTNTTAISVDHTYAAAGTNTVSLTAFGLGGSSTLSQPNYIIATNVVADTTPPALQIVSPTDYQIFTNAGITVSGTASDASGLNGVTVNGSAASVVSTNWSKSVTLSSGTNTLTVIATDASANLNTATQIVHAVFAPPTNNIPQIVAGLSVTNSLLQTGTVAVVVADETNTLTVAATDADGDILDYQWIFGDGQSTNTLLGVVAHVYTNACGPYNASVTVSDGQASTNSDLTVSLACQLQITKLQAKVNFKKSDADSCNLIADIVLPDGFDPTGKSLTVNIGGAQSSFILDTKNKGRNAQGQCSLKFNRKTSDWTVKVSLNKTSLQAAWLDEGLADTTTSKTGTEVTMTVVVLVGNESFIADKTLLYKAKEGKSGTAK
jgi:PKD repeat protein